ncbi:hypothetical protein ABW20_dc0106644 [Dactylellina cionopaga]|nr:hypothetical protein ABW20_dc0106644 [Dactylellina cionopaga]
MIVDPAVNPLKPNVLSEERIKEYLTILQFSENESIQVRKPSLGNLALLMVRQLENVPFCNIDIHYSKSHEITIELDYLFDKIARRRRGGYCSETNLLFCHLLIALGFNAWLAASRVSEQVIGVTDYQSFRASTHCVILVEFKNGKKYLAEVGFGRSNIVCPIELVNGATADGIGDEKYKLSQVALPESRRRELQWLMQFRSDANSDWHDCYIFTEDEITERDVVVASYWTSTKEDSFLKNICAVRVILEGRRRPIGRYTLWNRDVRQKLFTQVKELERLNSEEDRANALTKYWFIELSQEDRLAMRGRDPEIL